jgi:hypothetical protein
MNGQRLNKKGKSYSVQSLPDGVEQLLLPTHKMLCEKCGINDAFWSATWCEQCIWEFVKDE